MLGSRGDSEHACVAAFPKPVSTAGWFCKCTVGLGAQGQWLLVNLCISIKNSGNDDCDSRTDSEEFESESEVLGTFKPIYIAYIFLLIYVLRVVYIKSVNV